MANIRKIYAGIYDQYVDKIYRFVVLKVKSQEAAQDLTSEVFIRGWEAMKAQGSKIDNMQAFLYQIARNLIVDHYRDTAKAQLVSVDLAPVIDSGINLEERAVIGSDMDQVKAALANLKEEYREVLVWYYLDELSAPEIAKLTGKEEGNIRVLIHRALQALKEEMGGV
jgi:RNA polymerase sigma-70 factor (ECF subfamily)